MAADRGAFIDQSQSFNIHVAQPTYAKMSSIHFYAWKLGLKTGMYYLRTRPAANPIQFTVDKKRLAASRALNTKVNGNANDRSKHDQSIDVENKINTTTAEDLQAQMAGLVCSLDNKDDCLMCGA